MFQICNENELDFNQKLMFDLFYKNIGNNKIVETEKYFDIYCNYIKYMSSDILNMVAGQLCCEPQSSEFKRKIFYRCYEYIQYINGGKFINFSDLIYRNTYIFIYCLKNINFFENQYLQKDLISYIYSSLNKLDDFSDVQSTSASSQKIKIRNIIDALIAADKNYVENIYNSYKYHYKLRGVFNSAIIASGNLTEELAKKISRDVSEYALYDSISTLGDTKIYDKDLYLKMFMYFCNVKGFEQHAVAYYCPKEMLPYILHFDCPSAKAAIKARMAA